MPADERTTATGVAASQYKRSSRRVVGIALLAAALAPGLWWRGKVDWPEQRFPRTIHFNKLEAPTPRTWPADLKLVGAWHVTADGGRFGGYSALLASADGTLTAVSDNGHSLRTRRPDLPGDANPRFASVRAIRSPRNSDIEAATGDAATGRRWFAYEKTNYIRRFMSSDDDVGTVVSPPAMRDWARNGGAEAMTRLPDGRFIVLAEDAPWPSAGGRPGLLFPGDPVTGATPLEFTFRPPIGYDPSDMAALPDGRVVILLRVVNPLSPPFFDSMLVVADAADIVAGQDWRWRKLADLMSPVPRDNYEGLAIVPDRSGVTMWLISDDNFARFQRTLLLKLHWQIPPRGAAAK